MAAVEKQLTLTVIFPNDTYCNRCGKVQPLTPTVITTDYTDARKLRVTSWNRAHGWLEAHPQIVYDRPLAAGASLVNVPLVYCPDCANDFIHCQGRIRLAQALNARDAPTYDCRNRKRCGDQRCARAQ